MELYRRALDQFEEVLATVRDDQWDRPSACARWTVRDVAGHAVWGQEQLRAWATGTDYDRPGGPGAPHPGAMAGADPVATWQAARAGTTAVLTEEALATIITITGLGELPVAAVVTLLTTDLTGHAWDIGHAIGGDPRLDPDLVTAGFEWARKNMVRAPGYFGPELTPPAGADEQTRMLAFLGRAAWQPVPA